ncbi:MAG: BamA/TamA family outer membrane protein, partial [Rikenellaceae bacterium]|nr:BamA/TamA family outer membrane protein [Rikenellaceae bacterium]
LSLRGQTNGQYYKAFSVNFVEPWLGGKKPHSLNLGFYYSDQTNAYYMWDPGDKHFRTIGGSLGLGRRLKWPDPMFTLYTDISYQAYNLKDWDNFIVKNGTSNIIALQAALSRSTVDQPIYPRRGTEFSFSLSLTPPYSLFDGKDYSDPNMSENDRYRWIEYHKWNFSARWFTPLTDNNNLVLMAKAELGMIGSYNPDKPSPFEGYQVGGDGMSGYTLYGVDIVGLRGYENGTLTPSGQYSGAYNKFTLEMRYPFVNKPASTIFGLVFAEAGNAFGSLQEVDPFRLRRSAGVGVRLYLQVVGTIGFDWGYGFDKDVSGKKGGSQLHFSMGQNF